MQTRSSGEALAAPKGCFWCGDERAADMHPRCRTEWHSSPAYQFAALREAERQLEAAACDRADEQLDREIDKDFAFDLEQRDPDFLRSPL